MKRRAPCGSWPSPITSDRIVKGLVALDEIAIEGSDVYWLEGRPQEQGRYVLVRRDAAGGIRDLTPPPFNARTRVHEYGGGSYLVGEGNVWFSNFADQRLYRIREGELPEPVTPESRRRWADGVLDATRDRIVCVVEDHGDPDREAVNGIAAIDLGGNAIRILAGGFDFYSSPRVSPDGSRLAYLAWNHPNMPWDGTELRVAEIGADGTLGEAELVAGGPRESVTQPRWSPGGVLHFVSDRSGWWNLYRVRDGRVEPLREKESEFAPPAWVFGQASYGFESNDSLLCTFSEGDRKVLARLDTGTLSLTPIEIPYTSIGGLKIGEGFCVLTGGTSASPLEVARLDLETGRVDTLRHGGGPEIEAGYLSRPRAVSYPSAGGRTAHAFHYPPTNRDVEAPAGERPPLLVKAHGGPTGQARTTLRLDIQYWTSRGFAVLDVDYGGSSGYGRHYRELLHGNWGVVDVEDCIHGARWLVEQGLADGERLAIDGGSAGGYTTLCALTFHDVFHVGASLYGIGDLRTFISDTHKFESRYLESLVGPYPAEKERYEERSPIHHVDRLSCPVIFFQGDEDEIVPPNQSEIMVEALRAKGVPVAYILFEGEQHGFRKAESIKRALDGELWFYSRIFGFEPAENLEELPVENLDANPPGGETSPGTRPARTR